MYEKISFIHIYLYIDRWINRQIDIDMSVYKYNINIWIRNITKEF